MANTPIYGIADLHLGISTGHDMARFADFWKGHPQTLFDAWREQVPEQSLVLVPGDLSVATTMSDIVEDLSYVHELPGRVKVLSPGNHDRGMPTQGAARKALAHLPSLLAVKGTAERFAASEGSPGVVVVGTCGALTPGSDYFDEKPEHAFRYAKEPGRLRLAIERAQALMRSGDELIVAIHYPPFAHYSRRSEFTEIIERAGAALCVFGHIHTPSEWERVFQGVRGRTRYRLIAADYLRMRPAHLGVLTDTGLELADEQAPLAA